MYSRRSLGHSAHSRSTTEKSAEMARISLISEGEMVLSTRSEERSTDQSFYSSGDSDIEEGGEYIQPLETAGFINSKHSKRSSSGSKPRRSTQFAEVVGCLGDSIRENYLMLTGKGKAGEKTDQTAPRSPARVEPKVRFS